MQLTLTSLAEQIDAEHEAVLVSLSRGLDHARQCGECLAQAKELCGHGKWLSWLEKNCKVEKRQAQRYLRVYQQWDRIEAISKASPATLLGIDEALEVVSCREETLEDKKVESHAATGVWIEQGTQPDALFCQPAGKEEPAGDLSRAAFAALSADKQLEIVQEEEERLKRRAQKREAKAHEDGQRALVAAIRKDLDKAKKKALRYQGLGDRDGFLDALATAQEALALWPEAG